MTKPSTQIYGVFGNPISQSLSPILQNEWIKQFGIDAEYKRFEPELYEFKQDIEARFKNNLMGCNITSPFKNEAAQICDICSEDVARMGAANTLKKENDGKISAQNTDGSGLVLDLDMRANGWRDYCDTINIIGAGGAAAGVLPALLKTKVKNINIVARNKEKAITLLNKIESFESANSKTFKVLNWESLFDKSLQADIIINATTIGLKGEGALEIALDNTPAHALVYDMIYSPYKTKLLETSQNQNRNILNGLGMLVGQAAFAFNYWFGEMPDFAFGIKHLEEYLNC